MKIQKREKGEQRQTGLRRRLLAVLLCCAMLLPTFVTSVFAGDGDTGTADGGTVSAAGMTGTAVSNTYLLSVSTGIVPGDTVQYFGVRYRDNAGTERTEYIFVNGTGSLQYNDGLGLKTDWTMFTAGEELTMGSLFNYYFADDSGKPLRPYTTDQFLFSPYYGLKSVVGIDVYMVRDSSGKVKNEWSCADLQVYQVDTVYGVDMIGYLSQDRFLNFDGTLLAEMAAKDGIDFSVSTGGQLFHIGGSSSVSAKLNTSFSDAQRSYKSADRNRELIFSMDFADVYGGGIEAFVNEYKDKKMPLSQMILPEALTVVMTYQDSYGGYHTAHLPVITSALCWACTNNRTVADTKLNGIAQQGEKLVFSGTYPDFAKLTGFTLVYGDAAEKEAGLQFINGKIPQNTVNRRNERKKALASDNFSYTGIALYDATDGHARANVAVEEAVLNCSVDGSPIYAYSTSSTTGQTVSANSRKNIVNQMSAYEQGSYTVSGTGSAYVFEITTDMVENAGTTEDIQIAIRYRAKDGTSKTIGPMSLQECVHNFYGYWPGKNGDISYANAASSGGKMVFAVGNNDVSAFTSVELSLSASAKDEWQMRSFAIYRVDSYSHRRVEWLPEDQTAGGNVTDRTIYRYYSTDHLVQRYDKKVLLREEENSVTIHFADSGDDDGGGGDIEWNDDINWEQIRHSMTYNEALQDLGFTKVRYTYTVNVYVQKNANSSEIYGDCGSNNIFYFQLIFENGKSAYVQANQQLASDGFRAGKKESFTIAVNRDYGDVKAVRIIPSDIDDHDVFDKLNIQDIDVVQTSSAGLSRTWRVENVGWIDINYQEQGSKTDAPSRLRSEFEISQTCPITAKGYTINFLFALSTGAYPAGKPPMSGSLTATVYYYKIDSNTLESVEVDVAQEIAVYAGKSTVANEKRGISLPLGGVYAAMIDTSYMLREHHVDRFIVPLTDVRELVGIEFHAASDVETVWKINSVDVYQILSDGPMYLNSNGEYQRDAKLERLTQDKGTGGYELYVAKNVNTGETVYQDQLVDFEWNQIDINTNEWEAVIDRQPLGEDDALNLYVYTTNKSETTNAGNAIAAIKYQTRDQDKAQTIQTSLTPSRDGNMLYALGVGTRGLAALYEMAITTDNSVHVDHAVIQQVRSGVVINTYEMRFLGENAQFTVSAVPRPNTDLSEEQVVTLQFGDGTGTTELVPAALDMALSLSYTTVNDLGDTVYESSYIYLTDQNIRSIYAGMTAELRFNESYIKEIKKINVIGIGTLQATIDAVSITTTSAGSGGADKRTGQYGVSTQIPVTRTKQTYNCTSGSVVPLEVTFAIGSMVDGGGENGISAEIGVLNRSGFEQVVTVDDLGSYLVSGAFRSGEQAKVRILLKNVTGIRYIRICNNNPANKAWNLASFMADWMMDGSECSAAGQVNKPVDSETGCYLNFQDITVQLRAMVLNAEGGQITERNTTSNCELNIEAGQSIHVQSEITGALPGFGCSVTCAKVSGDGLFTVEEKEGVIAFTPSTVEGNSVYTITAVADEDESIRAVITVTVFPAPVVPAE